MRQKVALVTGARGFLANAVVRLLMENGIRVLRWVKRTPESGNNDSGPNCYCEMDLLKSEHPEVDYVFHLAAYIPYGQMNTPDFELVRSNIRLTGELVEAFRESRFLFSSSVAVYGLPANQPVTVDSPFSQPDLYGLSKIAGEAIVRNHPNYGIIRFASIVGPAMRPVSMIPKMIEQAKNAGCVTVFGDGSRQQNYIDVRDAARLCLALAQDRESRIVLGVGQQSYSNREVAEIIARCTGALIRYSGTDESVSAFYDPTHLASGLGFRHRYSLEQTISDMCL